MRRSSFAVASSAVLGAVLCAATPAFAQTGAASGQPVAMVAGVRDPYERTNRKIFFFDAVVDHIFLRPPAVFYHHAVPTPVRGGVHNMLTNLTGPIIFVNDVLQVRPVSAAKTLGRFVVNSTVGVGGMIDVGVKAGIPYHNADFGMTLARYGAPAGPFLYLPLLGPATVRDVVGRGFDAVADPFNVINYDGRWALAISRTGAGSVDARDAAEPVLHNVETTATDPYATLRSLYLQSRDAEIRGKAVDQKSVDALPDIGPTPAAGTAPVPAPSPIPPPPAPAPNTAPSAAIDGPPGAGPVAAATAE